MAALADIAIWSFIVSVLQFPNMGSHNLLVLKAPEAIGELRCVWSRPIAALTTRQLIAVMPPVVQDDE